jgi:hypothetical protein
MVNNSSKYLFYWLHYMLPSKTAFVIVKYPVDGRNS